jgi:hypothetical protein
LNESKNLKKHYYNFDQPFNVFTFSGYAANIKIYVAATIKQSGDKLSWTNGTLCGTIGSSKLEVAQAGGKWFYCPDPAIGRYVIFVRKPSTEYLNLCEVEVYHRKVIHSRYSTSNAHSRGGG